MRKSGQAMIEFVVAILVVVAIVTGILQFVELSGAKGELVARVRGKAGREAISPASIAHATPEYLQTWEEGADETRHTADDRRVNGFAAVTLQQGVVERTVPAGSSAGWSTLNEAVNDDLPTLRASMLPMFELDFVHARLTEDIDLLPAMRNWLYGKDHVTVAAEVWLPRLHLEGFEP